MWRRRPACPPRRSAACWPASVERDRRRGRASWKRRASSDYRPSEVARSLKRRSTQTLGLIITDIENPYFPQLVRAVEDAARAAGYAVLLCNAGRRPGARVVLSRTARRPSGRRAHHRREQPRRPPYGVAVIAADPRGPGQHHGGGRRAADDHVGQRGGRRIAADHLLSLGHRRFGYLMPPPRNVDAPVRLAGVRAALAAAGCRPDGLTVADGEALVGGGERAADDLLGRVPETTAIVAYNDLMAIGALRARPTPRSTRAGRRQRRRLR